jgi:transposase
MATERLPMRKIREILRQKWVLGHRHRAIARALGIGVGTVSEMTRAAGAAGLDWARVQSLSDGELDQAVYGARPQKSQRAPLPAPEVIDLELRKVGVTLRLLHVEYREQHPEGYGYTQFCDHYGRWKQRQGVVMRHAHRAGEKLFSDYSGKKPHWIDPDTGEVQEVELFVAVLGASNYTYAEVTPTQRIADWVCSHTRGVEFFEGVPALLVPDQLKSAVNQPCRYEPEIQRTFQEWAEHYDTVVLPARPRKPRDKAKVEVGVQVAQRWILARMRNQTFFSFEELSARVRELLTELNARVMRRYGKSRRELFEALDRPALKPLPAQRYEVALWSKVKVNIDYHVEVEHHYYSVHHTLVHEQLEARVAGGTVELYRNGERVAAHRSSLVRGGFTTEPAHMPKAHQQHLEWTPGRMIRWAQQIGPMTGVLVEAILADRPHPEQGYRSCLGIIRLHKRYGTERLEQACARAHAARARSYKHVDSILRNGLDRLPLSPAATRDSPSASAAPSVHEHVRGQEYYR